MTLLDFITTNTPAPGPPLTRESLERYWLLLGKQSGIRAFAPELEATTNDQQPGDQQPPTNNTPTQ